jgi:predicted transposase YdaD
MVCLGEDSENTDGMNKNILKLLRVLLSGKVTPIKKKEILNNDFDVVMSVNTYKEMNSMCNLSQGIRREAELKGRLEGRLEGKLEGKLEGGISTLIETYQELGISVEQTLNKLMEKFGISEEEAKSKIEEYRK